MLDEAAREAAAVAYVGADAVEDVEHGLEELVAALEGILELVQIDRLFAVLGCRLVNLRDRRRRVEHDRADGCRPEDRQRERGGGRRDRPSDFAERLLPLHDFSHAAGSPPGDSSELRADPMGGSRLRSGGKSQDFFKRSSAGEATQRSDGLHARKLP